MSDQTVAEVLLGLIGFIVVAIIVWYVLQVIACWRMFKKAGEPGWKAIIPLYNTYIEYKISWGGAWFFVFLIASVVGTIMVGYSGVVYAIGMILEVIALVCSIYFAYKLSKAFGHGGGFAVGLFFLNPIFLLILGFGSSRYQGKQ